MVVGWVYSSSLTRPACSFSARLGSPYTAIDDGYMKMTGRPCDSASCCANSSRFSVPSTLTWCADSGVNSERVDSSAARWNTSSTWILRQDPFEQRPIEDRPGDLAVDQRGNRWVEPGEIERDDRAAGLGREALDQAVADLAACACDQDDRFSHRKIILNGS